MKNEYKLVCPKCKQKRVYSSASAYNYAIKHNTCCHNCVQREVSSQINKLLDDNCESYYWIGFLLADGTFSNNRLSFTLSNKDKEQVIRLGQYIKCNNIIYSTNWTRLSIMNKNVISKICEKFNILPNKTYNPSNYKIPHGTLGLSLIAGFIDGDGCIRYQTKRKDAILTIKCHGSWLSFLNQISLILVNKQVAKIDSLGYAVLNISDNTILSNLYNKLKLLKLPLLSRKWDIINLNFISRKALSLERKSKAYLLKTLGYTNSQIANELNVSKGCITKYFK